ncbi:hypothetical protein [Aneurinibacillus tyrosinisolvens]|uniref:hypothetical protein n=1 Tax=Aneurinibacillus tyrosinisolvens TaxID=1443435 RepID=UPI000A8F520A|nr:hypothetical protein [Aneurinibacillus tyrosinisolvens]
MLYAQETEKTGPPYAERLQKWKASYQRILKRGEVELRRLFREPLFVLSGSKLSSYSVF